jgi:putative NADH-flavin reductase
MVPKEWTVMRVAVIGASGRTGGEVVRQALGRGHDVLAVARRPQSLSCVGPGSPAGRVGRLAVREADVLDVERLAEALEGVDAVISAVGIGASRRPTEVYSTGTSNLLTAMSSTGAVRLAVVSAAPVGPREEQPALQRYVAIPVLQRVFGSTYTDMRRMETLLRNSAVEWTALRPPRLMDRPPIGHYRLDRRPLPKGRTITIADLATALLDCLSRTDLQRQTLYIAD